MADKNDSFGAGIRRTIRFWGWLLAIFFAIAIHTTGDDPAIDQGLGGKWGFSALLLLVMGALHFFFLHDE